MPGSLRLGNRDDVATKESDALGQADGRSSELSQARRQELLRDTPQINRLGERVVQ